jgi:hypothetical protein
VSICGGLVLLLYHAESEPDFVLVPLTIFLFPDGRLPSPLWRRVVGGALTLAVATAGSGEALTLPPAYRLPTTRSTSALDPLRE